MLTETKYRDYVPEIAKSSFNTAMSITLRQKLAILAAIPAIVIAIFIYAYFPNLYERQAIRSVAAKASSVSSMSAYALGPALDFGLLDELDEILKGAKQFDDVLYIYVQTTDDDFVYSFERNTDQVGAVVSLSKTVGLSADRNSYHISQPIHQSGNVLGFVYMGFSLEEVNYSLSRGQLVLALVIGLVLLFGLIAAYLISGYISQPLIAIEETVSAVAAGDLTKRVKVVTRDEVAKLARRINHMIDTVQDSHVALSTSEAKFRAVIENSTDVIALMDSIGTLTYLSPAAADVVGRTPNELANTSIFSHVHPDDHRILRIGLEKATTRRGHNLITEVRWRHKDGAYRNLAFRGKNLLDYPGIEGLLVTARDNTATHKTHAELVRAKDQAEEMVRLKSAFLANMSHEIRTPLTSILGFSQCLMVEAEDPHRELAGHIEKSGHRLLNTLNSVLELAQLQANSMELHLQTIDVAEEVKETVELLTPLAGENVELKIVDPVCAAYAKLDRTALRRILNNLVGNALKFTKQGIVTVTTDVSDESVKINVQDTGVGISEEFLPSLFDEFKQESEGLDRSYEGNGLGLSITKQLTELMNGTVGVKSVRGLGSVFTATFTRTSELPAEKVPVPQPDERLFDLSIERPGPCANILIVEDNRETRQLMERVLKPQYHCRSVASGADLHKAIKSDRYCAVLMDINLGSGDDGIQLLKDLKNHPDYKKVPIIAVTAYAMPGDEKRFQGEGFDNYVAKPFKNKKLLRVLEQTLESRVT